MMELHNNYYYVSYCGISTKNNEAIRGCVTITTEAPIRFASDIEDLCCYINENYFVEEAEITFCKSMGSDYPQQNSVFH